MLMATINASIMLIALPDIFRGIGVNPLQPGNTSLLLFAAFSILLSLTWMHGTAAAWWLIGMRLGQGVGGAMLMANSSAILTDAA